jgi:lipopolysaccharide export system permease protein
VTIYDREKGELGRTVEADRAVPENGAWRLDNVRIYDSAMNLTTKAPHMRTLAGVEPRRFTLAKVRPDERSFFALGDTIREMKQAGRPTTEVETGYWHKLTGPLSTVLMPLLAAVAAFGLARSGQVLLRATIGMALGFTYFVVDNFSLAMGNVGAYSPLLAACAPVFLFLLIGEMVLIQTEE